MEYLVSQHKPFYCDNNSQKAVLSIRQVSALFYRSISYQINVFKYVCQHFFLGNFANRAMPFSWKGALVSTSDTCCLQKLVIYVLINLRRHKYIFLFQKLYNSNMWYHVMLNQHLATETSFVLNIYFTFRPWIFRTCSYTHIFFY